MKALMTGMGMVRSLRFIIECSCMALPPAATVIRGVYFPS